MKKALLVFEGMVQIVREEGFFNLALLLFDTKSYLGARS